MNVQETVENFNRLTEVIEQAIESDPDILGEDKWLRHVIHSWDLRMNVCADGYTLNVWGSVWTSQTQSFEEFEFFIDSRDLEI